MWAEACLIDQRSREVIPGLEGTSMDSSNLIIRQSIIFVLGHESLHAKEIQIPRVFVVRTSQLTDLETGGSRPANIALAIGGSPRAAHTSDGCVAGRLSLEQLSFNLLYVGFDSCINIDGTILVRVVMATMLKSH